MEPACGCGDVGCSDVGCAACEECYQPYFAGPIVPMWVRAEYLGWALRGMDTPPLVTRAPRGSYGVMGQAGTDVVYGDDSLVGELRSGARIRLGLWLDPCQMNAVEGEYLILDDEADHFCAHSVGLPTLARPFFNSRLNREDSELIGFLPAVDTPVAGSGAVSGGISIHSRSAFQGAGIRWLGNIASCDNGCGPAQKWDVLVGYRFLQLNEGLAIREQLYSSDPEESSDPALGNVAFVVRDQFDSRNTFHGADLGMRWMFAHQRWSFELLGKLALGGNSRRVAIRGSTTQTDTATGVATTSTLASPADGEGGVYTGGGLLAQRSNIGTYDDGAFSFVPELGLTLGYQLNSHWRAMLGYTLLFWTNVARPGDQIDRRVNDELLPDELTPLTGPNRPAFSFHDSTLCVQGFNLGLEYAW